MIKNGRKFILSIILCSLCLLFIAINNNGYVLKAVESENDFPLDVNSQWNELENKNSVKLEWEDRNKGEVYQVVQKENEQEEVVVRNTKKTTVDIENVFDTIAPNSPELSLVKDSDNGLELEINSKDNGSIYQWYVATENGKSKSVEKEIVSDIKGYIYEIDNSSDTTPTVTKNTEGNIENINVLAEGASQTVTLENVEVSDEWIHIVSVDRADNVSETTHVKLIDLQEKERASADANDLMSFNIQRTENTIQIVDFQLDSSKDKKMKSMEFLVPEQYEMGNITLPTSWQKIKNSDVTENGKTYASYTIGMYEDVSKNTITEIKKFLEQLKFNVKSDKVSLENNSGEFKIILHERIYTSYKHPDGTTHYYTFIPRSGAQKTWLQSYNLAKGMKYKGLTGYLATLTSAEEHTFVYEQIAKQSGWLGGTRMVINNNKSKINDPATLSESIGTFNLTVTYATEYYWACGPEAGLVFFNKPTYDSGGAAPVGVYQGFNNPKATPPQGGKEPNNAGTEYVVEFAQGSAGSPTKYWNDLSYNRDSYNTGYYVEFSEYGTQKEGVEETDVASTAVIPQKISLKAFDEEGNELSSGDILKDQTLKVGSSLSVTPTTIELYDFVKILDKDGNTITPEDSATNRYSFTVTDSYTQGKLIYSARKLVIHARQVVVDSNENLPIPSTSWSSIQSSTADGTERQLFPLKVDSSKSVTDGYKKMIITCKNDEPNYTYDTTIPMYYQLIGYVTTTIEKTHEVDQSTPNKPKINAETTPEVWITTYIKPTTTTPLFNHSDRKDNNMGSITITP